MRRAQIDVADEILSKVEPLLREHGLAIVSRRRSDSDFHDYTRLTVEGDVLPDFCEGGSPLVVVTCTQEEVAGERRVWISAIEPAPVEAVFQTPETPTRN